MSEASLSTTTTCITNVVLSPHAAVFVPSSKWAQPEQQDLIGNCQFISLDGYSDDDTASGTMPAELPTVPERSEETPRRRPWRSATDKSEKADAPLVRPWRQHRTSTLPAASTSRVGAKPPPWRKTQPSTTIDSPIDDEPFPRTESNSKLSLCSTGCTDDSPSVTSADTCSLASEGLDEDSESNGSKVDVDEKTDNDTVSEYGNSSSPWSIPSLLQWRWAVGAAEGAESTLCAQEVDWDTSIADVAVADSPSSSLSWRSSTSQEKSRSDDMTWRSEAATDSPSKGMTKLRVSDNSWAASQKSRRDGKRGILSDEDVVRSIKSILNKLTIEKFDQLASQLTCCGISNSSHLEALIQEIFDKATTQHHFIDMYADLCVLLHLFYAQNPILVDPKMTFKKVLLNCCQSSFEKHLSAPSDLKDLTAEDAAQAQLLYKMRMLGNIRFVGSLLVRKMLVSKIMLSIMEELITDPTSESLESLSAFLIVVGPTFDTPDFAHKVAFNAIFKQVESLSKKQSVDSRARCLLKDVLDIRASGWDDRRPKKIDGPSKLEDVAIKAAAEGTHCPTISKVATASEWDQLHAPRLAKLAQQMGAKSAALQSGRGQACDSSSPSCTNNEATPKFDLERCRSELISALKELYVSHEVTEALQRFVVVAVPTAHQAELLCEMMSHIAEEGCKERRTVGFDLLAGLFRAGHWSTKALRKGLRSFIDDIFADLKCDVPTLSVILRDEATPAFAPLLQAGKLTEEQLSELSHAR